MNFKIMQGDNRETLKTLKDNSVDAVVCDPPYGLDFLGKAWDANTGAIETYHECLRVLKPGGYILAFSAARTYHHLAVTLEQAGFEIRDQLMWLYASGFPKGQDLGKAIQKRQGVKETEKKDLSTGGGGIKNAMTKLTERHTGGTDGEYATPICTSPEAKQWEGWKTALKPAHEPICMARKPFKGSTVDNVLKHRVGALNIDASRIGDETYKQEISGRYPSNVIGEIEDYQKFFYCPKVSRKERHIGFDTTNIPTNNGGFLGTDGEWSSKHWHDSKQVTIGNNHPTVKPVALMRWLIQLVTAPNGTVLDPFCGSGSTGMAAVELGHTFIGCELDENYVSIANRRITKWNDTYYNKFFKGEQ